MRELRFNLLVTVSLLATALCAGCGSDNRESSSTSNNGAFVSALTGNVPEVGDTECFQCHASSADPVTGETFIAQYRRSLHAEIGCESCHGGGAQHAGIGPFPFQLNGTTTDAQRAARCATCHDGVTTYKGKVAPLTSSRNFQNGNHANPFSAEEAHEPICARCHSHEGSMLYGRAGLTGDRSIVTNAAFQPVLGRDPETFNTMRCDTCHEHGGNLRASTTRDANGNVVGWDPNNNLINDQVDLCTGCHTLSTNKGAKLVGSGNVLAIATGPTTFKNVSTAAFYHNTRWFRTLGSTHVDQAASGTLSTGTLIEGYVMRQVGESAVSGNVKNPCFDCHGHEFQTNTRALADRPERGRTIFTDWGFSGHAGKILPQKLAAAAGATNNSAAQVDAVMKAGVTEASGAAWSHYDWDKTFTAAGASDRGDCQMCHTSTGFANYQTNPATYTPAVNDFSHLSGWRRGTATAGVAGTATTSSGQNELLYCWGCHSNSGAGVLRGNGNATLGFQINNQPVVIQNLGRSAGCTVCHGGRGSASVAIETDATRSTRFIGHHAPTAGILFAEQTRIAFEYPGRNYVNAAFQHDDIARGANGAGPCVSCHMNNKVHTFQAISSAGGVAQKIYAQTLCNSCHTSYTPAQLETQKTGYAQASLILNNYVNNVAGFTNYLGAAISSAAADAALPNYFLNVEDNAYGAFQNAKIRADEPCAYVHNPTYIKRVLFDSIDWMDNGVLNGTISIDAAATPNAAAWFGVPAGGTIARP